MADNIGKIFPPSNIRLCVEPVEVELENGYGSLLFSALQSAFPQSTGIYFRPKGADCRVMLKFDGRRFWPPNGGWNGGIDYFVELNGSRHTPFPFGSYEHASKQFERSVNLVQRMMNGTMAKGGGTKLRMESGGGGVWRSSDDQLDGRELVHQGIEKAQQDEEMEEQQIGVDNHPSRKIRAPVNFSREIFLTD